MLSLSWGMLKEEWYERGPTKNFLGDFYSDCMKYHQITMNEVMWIAVIAVMFTVHRYIYTKLVLNVSNSLAFVGTDLRFFDPIHSN